jgi:hypothetical protein
MTGEPAIDDHRKFLSTAARTNQPRNPVALLATDPVIYGRACTYASLTRSTLTVEVFRDLDKAEEWLTAQAKATEKGGA